MDQFNNNKGIKKPDVFGKSHHEPKLTHSRPIRNEIKETGPSIKRPKLEISKNVNSLLTSSSSSGAETETNGNDDLWGELDIDECEMHQIDETIALSQVTTGLEKHENQRNRTEKFSSTKQSNTNNSKDCYDMLCKDESDENSEKHDKHDSVSSNQTPGNTKSETGTKVQVIHTLKRSTESRYQSKSEVKTTPGRLPFRRVASSGWPSTFDLCSSSSSSGKTVKFNKAKIGTNDLHCDLEQLKLENEKLGEDLLKKRGEITFLRDRMKQLKTERDKMEREMLNKISDVKSEAERTSSSYLKQIKSLKGQLDVKEMELNSAEQKRQHLSSVDRINPESPISRFRNGSGDTLIKNELSCTFASCQIKRTLHNKSLDLIKATIPDLLQPSQPEDPIDPQAQMESLKKEDAFNSTRPSTLREVTPAQDKKVQLPYSAIQTCGTLLSDLQDVYSNRAHCVISQVLNLCHQILIDFLKQLQSTLKLGNGYIERERELLQKCFKQLPLDKSYNLLNHSPFYHEERGICARRALGLLLELVEVSDFAAEQILNREDKEASSNNVQNSSSEILLVIRDIVIQIDNERRSIMCQGVLAGIMAFIEKILNTSIKVSLENQKIILDILRWVVFSRPGNLVLYNILKVLVAATKYSHIINSLCRYSEDKTYQENLQQGLIQFTPDTCILQILCWQIQIAETPRKHLMSDISILWLFSLLSAGYSELSPKWLNAATVVSTPQPCQCLTLLLQTNFFLLSKACSVYPSANDTDKKQIEKLLTNGVHLVYNLMTENDHLMAKMNHNTLCYHEHFLHSMKKLIADLSLDEKTYKFLEICIEEQERQPVNLTGCENGNQSSFIEEEINSYFLGNAETPWSEDILDV